MLLTAKEINKLRKVLGDDLGEKLACVMQSRDNEPARDVYDPSPQTTESDQQSTLFTDVTETVNELTEDNLLE